MSQADFFDGMSLPRNKELMRIYKDLDMVEQLGSGVPRILKSYSQSCFQFGNNHLRMIFPSSEPVYGEEYSNTKETMSGKSRESVGGQVSGLTTRV